MDTLITDMDVLLGSDAAFLLGPWVEGARGWGHNASEAELYSFNAKYVALMFACSMGSPSVCAHFGFVRVRRCTPRYQITGWSFHYEARLPGTGDYAAKMWAGLMGTYYRARWALCVWGWAWSMLIEWAWEGGGPQTC